METFFFAINDERTFRAEIAQRTRKLFLRGASRRRLVPPLMVRIRDKVELTPGLKRVTELLRDTRVALERHLRDRRDCQKGSKKDTRETREILERH